MSMSYFNFSEFAHRIKDTFMAVYGNTYYMSHMRVYPSAASDTVEILRPCFEIAFKRRVDRNAIDIRAYYVEPDYMVKKKSFRNSVLMYQFEYKDTEFFAWLTNAKLKETIDLTLKFIPYFQKWEPYITKDAIHNSMGIPNHEMDTMPYEYHQWRKDLQTEVELLAI